MTDSNVKKRQTHYTGWALPQTDKTCSLREGNGQDYPPSSELTERSVDCQPIRNSAPPTGAGSRAAPERNGFPFRPGPATVPTLFLSLKHPVPGASGRTDQKWGMHSPLLPQSVSSARQSVVLFSLGCPMRSTVAPLVPGICIRTSPTPRRRCWPKDLRTPD